MAMISHEPAAAEVMPDWWQDAGVRKVYIKMITWLARRDFSEQQLVDAAVRYGHEHPEAPMFTSENARMVLDYLKQKKFVNEERYAGQVFERLINNRDGLAQIKNKMRRRKINPIMIASQLKPYEQQDAVQDFSKTVAMLQRKRETWQVKYGDDAQGRMKVRMQTMAWLQRRGYRGAEITAILKQLSV